MQFNVAFIHKWTYYIQIGVCISDSKVKSAIVIQSFESMEECPNGIHIPQKHAHAHIWTQINLSDSITQDAVGLLSPLSQCLLFLRARTMVVMSKHSQASCPGIYIKTLSDWQLHPCSAGHPSCRQGCWRLIPIDATCRLIILRPVATTTPHNVFGNAVCSSASLSFCHPRREKSSRPSLYETRFLYPFIWEL